MEPSESADEFIAAGLAAYGIEADEVDLAVIRAAHQLFWGAILELLEFDTTQIPVEPAPDLSQAPPAL